jgi:methionyl-tRNA formyltransferase
VNGKLKRQNAKTQNGLGLLCMDVVFLGSGAFGLPSLEALTGSAHRVLHVISQPDRPAGRGKHLTPTPAAAWAESRGMPVTRTENANAPEVLGMLRELKPQCLVVIAFGQKLSDELLHIAPHGGINLHSSLLPKYRGAAPINWAVINGDAEAGACVIEMTAQMDAGDIFASAATPVGASETAGELHDRLAALGAPLLPRVLDEFAAGSATRLKQDPALATRAAKLSREMAWVDFTQPAAVVSARLRGMSPWPGIQVEITDAAGKARGAATILKCQATQSRETHVADICGSLLADRSVACGTGSVELITLHPAGKKPMDLQALANGYGLAKGARLRSLVQKP